MSGESVHYKQTRFGFEYGSAAINRVMSDVKKGWVVIDLKTPKPKYRISIYVTRTGKVRIWNRKKELKL